MFVFVFCFIVSAMGLAEWLGILANAESFRIRSDQFISTVYSNVNQFTSLFHCPIIYKKKKSVPFSFFSCSLPPLISCMDMDINIANNCR